MTQLWLVQDGIEARDEAMDRVERAAAEHWKSNAYWAIRYVARVRETFTTDAIWWVLDKMEIPRPKEPRVLGPLMRSAVNDGVCERTDKYARTVQPQGNRRPIQIYKSLIWDGRER